MRVKKHIISFLYLTMKVLVFSVLLFTVSTAAIAQSASDFFQQGMNEFDLEKKISSFESAVLLDPGYVEAYFYLGLAYKSKQAFAQALVMLNKAYFTNPYGLNNSIKMRILFELGSVHSSLNNTTEAVDALNGAKNIAAGNTKMISLISYELGNVYVKSGDYKRALLAFREGKRLDPQAGIQFDQAIDIAAANQALDQQYKKAESYIESGRIDEAVSLFEEIFRINPDFKEVAVALRRAKTEALNPARQESALATLYLQAQEATVQGDYGGSIQLYEKIVQSEPQYKDVQTRLRALKNRSGENAAPAPPAQKKTPQIELLYRRGLKAFNSENWSEALKQFSAAQKIDRSYKKLADLHKQTKQKIQSTADEEREKGILYDKAIAFAETQRWRQALETFRKLYDIDPFYRDTKTQLLNLRDQIAMQKRNYSAVDSLYKKADFAFQSRQWLTAVLAFEKIKVMEPNYKDVEFKLSQAQQQLEQTQTSLKSSDTVTGSKIFLSIFGGFMASVLLVAGAFAFSPTLKARMYLIRGNNRKASDTYAAYLGKRPEKVKVYPILAGLYLLEERRDEQAIRIYETILKLNMVVPNRSQMNSIVANYYLTQGRRDGNAIAIMEQELNNKLKADTAL